MRASNFTAIASLLTIVAGFILNTSTQAATLSVIFESGSETWPTGTTFSGSDGIYRSMTDDPLGPFSGQSVHFRGTNQGGALQVYRYRLNFDKDVQLSSIVVSGAAWAGGQDVFLLTDENGRRLDRLQASGSNVFREFTLNASGAVGDTFFLEEINLDTNWRYRSNIDVRLVPIPAAFWMFGSALIGLSGMGIQRRSKA